MKRPPGNIRRPPGLKMRAFENSPFRPGYARLASASEGENQKLPFQGTENLLRRGHKNSGSLNNDGSRPTMRSSLRDRSRPRLCSHRNCDMHNYNHDLHRSRRRRPSLPA